jgi:predicted amidophosphoribosyltransferase
MTALDLRLLNPSPAGFDDCPTCAYAVDGSPAICFPCSTAGGPPSPARACDVCGERLGEDGRCPNTVCTLEDRYFTRIHTVCERSEEMWSAVYRYKYGGERFRSQVLGRILVGYLEARREEMRRYDVITTGAIHVGPGAPRLWDYLRLIVDAASAAGPDWPFAPGLISKSEPTARFLGIGVEERRAIAEGHLRAVLSVPERQRITGRRVLVFDDIYSEGFSLREMARVLLAAGAAEVDGLVLARRKGG